MFAYETIFYVSFLFINPFRVFKPFAAQPVYTLTSRSRRATGKMLSRTASRKTKNERSSRCSSPTNLSVKMDSWHAVTETASSAVCSATAKKTVPMDPTRTRVVSNVTPISSSDELVMSEVAFKSRNITKVFSTTCSRKLIMVSSSAKDLESDTERILIFRQKLRRHSNGLVRRASNVVEREANI